MNRLVYLTLFFIISLFFLQCNKTDKLSEIPKIVYIGMTNTQMIQSDLNRDSIWLQFSFEDGDGDLSYGTSDPRKDIVVKDSRTGIIQDEYKIPNLPPSDNEAQRGTITILIYTSCCLFPNNIPPCSSPVQYPIDSLQYQIFIRDKAGNESNVIHSDFLKLRCI